MPDKFEIGDWIKVLGEDEYYNIKSIDEDSGFVEVQDIGGHTWYTAKATIVKKLTKKEVQLPPGGEGSHQEEADDTN